MLLAGVFAKRRLLDLVQNFVVFEDTGGGKLVKKIAGYHQFHAVRAAIAQVVAASRPDGRPGQRGKGGVIWHTQGSGKSLTMLFYAGKVIQQAALANPTLVILTDRNDLDDQLFGTFARCHDLLRQTPVQAESRAICASCCGRQPAAWSSPPSRSSCPPPARPTRCSPSGATSSSSPTRPTAASTTFIDGFAAHLRDALPNASFIGFTGTPIELTTPTPAPCSATTSTSTTSSARSKTARPSVSTTRAASPGSQLDEAERPHLDPEFEEVTEGEERRPAEKLKSKTGRSWRRWSAREKRIALMAADLVRALRDAPGRRWTARAWSSA